MIIESITFAVLLALIAVLLIDDIRVRFARTKTSAKYLQAEIDRSIMSEKMQELMSEKELNSLQESEGFIKFLSESREWAFGYIEEVQAALDDFDNKVTPILAYYSTYGSAVNGLHTEIAKEISDAYEGLKKVLPAK